MKSQKMILCMVLLLMALGVNAFPHPTKAQEVHFDRLYEECVRYALSPKVLVSSKAFEELNGDAYRELELSGTEVLELICKKIQDFEKGNSRSEAFARVAGNLRDYNRLSLLYYLWDAITCQGRFQDQDFPWVDESITTVWKGGSEIGNARAEYLLNEWRLAREEGRTNDVRRAKGAIASLGLFSFPTLFNELQAGHDDVIKLLESVGWRSRWRKELDADPKAFDRRTLLDWWEENKKAYELPRQALGFKGSADLWKWKRTGK